MPILLFNFTQYNLLFNTIIYLIAALAVILIIVLLIERKIKSQIRRHLSTHGVMFMKALRTIETMKKPYQKIVLISHLSKQMFKELFKLNFFPTFEEARKLAKEKNFSEIELFCNRMTELIYTGKKPTEEEGFEMLSRTEQIIKKYMLIKEFQQITQAEKSEKANIEQKKQVIKPVIKVSKPVKSEIIKKTEEIPIKVEKPIIDESSKKLKMILSSIIEGRKMLQERDEKAAYQYYSTALNLYKQLDKKTKAQCQSKLLEFYKEILAAFMK